MTSSTFRVFLEKLIASRQSKESRKPLFFGVASGGGAAIVDILKLPGASRLVKGIYLPYAVTETSEFIRTHLGSASADVFSKKTVGAASAELLAMAAYTRDLVRNFHGNVIYAGVTAAITTNRWRRGNNEAYICIIPGECIIRLKMSKLSEWLWYSGGSCESCWWSRRTILSKREQEDELISKVTLMLALDSENPFLKELVQNGSIEILPR